MKVKTKPTQKKSLSNFPYLKPVQIPWCGFNWDENSLKLHHPEIFSLYVWSEIKACQKASLSCFICNEKLICFKTLNFKKTNYKNSSSENFFTILHPFYFFPYPFYTSWKIWKRNFYFYNDKNVFLLCIHLFNMHVNVSHFFYKFLITQKFHFFI